MLAEPAVARVLEPGLEAVFGEVPATGSGSTPSHTYSEPGTYSVELTVTNPTATVLKAIAPWLILAIGQHRHGAATRK